MVGTLLFQRRPLVNVRIIFVDHAILDVCKGVAQVCELLDGNSVDASVLHVSPDNVRLAETLGTLVLCRYTSPGYSISHQSVVWVAPSQ